MQVDDVVNIMAVMMFGGNTLVAGLILTGIVVMMLMGLMSLANPPPMAYILIAFLGVLISMGLGWLDYWIAVLMGLVSAGALALRLSETWGRD